MRAYAIGDIHGHLDKLQAAHALIAEDRARCGDMDAPVVHIGDLVDRGPDCKGVVQYLIDGQARGENWVVLKGNHDRMMEMFLREHPMVDTQLLIDHNWLHPRIGGIETLASYGVEVPEDPHLSAAPQSPRSCAGTPPRLSGKPAVQLSVGGISISPMQASVRASLWINRPRMTCAGSAKNSTNQTSITAR